MESTSKLHYEAPETLGLELTHSSVICTSGGTERFTTGNSYGEDDFE